MTIVKYVTRVGLAEILRRRLWEGFEDICMALNRTVECLHEKDYGVLQTQVLATSMEVKS